MDNPNKKRATDDLSNIEYNKTWSVPEDASISQALSEILRAAVEDTNKPESRGLLFYIANQSKPIIVTNVDVIRIGRGDNAAGVNPNVDLAQFYASELGVSRYHAEIVYTDGAYFIKDMGSTNGTWVNNSKLAPYRQTPLEDGDQIRLGHFTLLVKFNVEE